MMARPPDQARAGRSVLQDTSILIEQQKREKYAAPVRDGLASYAHKGISSYSKLEIKRAWLQRFGYIHSVCRKEGVDSVPDVLDWIAKKLTAHPQQQRMLQTCMSMVSQFLETELSRSRHSRGLSRLRAHCKNIVLSSVVWLKRMRLVEFTGTRCIRAEELPKENRDGSLNVSIPHCKPSCIQCAVHELFIANKATFVSIADHVDENESASAELKHMRLHIQKAQENPTHLCDSRHCHKLADGLIAVDGKQMDEFAANNNAEWLTIASVLQKTLVNPVTGERTEPDSSSRSSRIA